MSQVFSRSPTSKKGGLAQRADSAQTQPPAGASRAACPLFFALLIASLLLPDLATATAFRIKPGQGICMQPGRWHATRVDEEEVQCLMITRRSTTVDLIKHLEGASPLKESALVNVELEIGTSRARQQAQSSG